MVELLNLPHRYQAHKTQKLEQANSVPDVGMV